MGRYSLTMTDRTPAFPSAGEAISARDGVIVSRDGEGSCQGSDRNRGETMITDSQIRDLSTEAASAGDIKQVAICQRALNGSQRARRECARVIREAAGQ